MKSIFKQKKKSYLYKIHINKNLNQKQKNNLKIEKNMKSALIISLLILGVYSNCNCDSGEYMDDTTWTCKTPTQETENCLYY